MKSVMIFFYVIKPGIFKNNSKIKIGTDLYTKKFNSEDKLTGKLY